MDPPWGGHERGRPVKRTPFFAVVGVWAGHVKDKKEVKGADRESWGSPSEPRKKALVAFHYIYWLVKNDPYVMVY